MAAAACGLLLLLALVTGATASPFVIALAAALILLVRQVSRPLVLGAPVLATVVLLAPAAFAGDVAGRDVVVAFVLLMSVIPGLIWRREARQAHAHVAGMDASLSIARQEDATRDTYEAEEEADLARALAAVAARVGADNVVLWDVDGYHGVAHVRAASLVRPARSLRLAGDALGWVWEQGMRLRLDPPPAWSLPGLTVVVERLRRNDEHGLLATYAFDPAHLPADDVVFEETAVYLRGMLALQQARADQVARSRRMDALLGGLNRIPGELELGALAADLCATAIAVTDATGAAVGIWTAATEQGELIAVAGRDGGPAAGDIFEPPASELAIAIRADSEIVRSAAEWRIGRTHVARPDEPWTERPRSLAVLPLRGSAGTIGVLAVWSSVDPHLDSYALGLLHALSPYAALHLEHAREFGHMRETAERDPLTQLRNRRAFDQIFDAETDRFERYGHPLTLLMLDLDHFKDVNDRWGHPFGDHVLRQTTDVIAANVRESDILGRYGGEEFALALPETSEAAALGVGEKLRAALEAQEFRTADTPPPGEAPVRLTVSIGIASLPVEEDQDEVELIGRADQALYEAKRTGRNRVIAYRKPTANPSDPAGDSSMRASDAS